MRKIGTWMLELGLDLWYSFEGNTRPVKSVRGSCCTSQSKDQRKTANACLRPVGKTSGSVLPSLSSVEVTRKKKNEEVETQQLPTPPHAPHSTSQTIKCHRRKIGLVFIFYTEADCPWPWSVCLGEGRCEL